MDKFENWYIFDPSCQIPFLDEIYQSCFGKDPGFVIDVGAFDGRTCSNSLGLIERGWQALLFEPVSEHFNKLKLLYKNSTNVLIRNVGIGSECGLASIHLAGALSTLSSELFEEYQQIEWAKDALTDNQEIVKMSTLDCELDRYCPGRIIDVLNIDTEGFESQVLSGFNIEKHRPKMVIIELSDFHPHLKTNISANKHIYLRFIKLDYLVIYKDAINTIFLRSDIYNSIH